MPSAAGGWAAVATALARKADSLARDDRWWHLILSAATPELAYLQLGVHRARVVAEVSSEVPAEGAGSPLLDGRASAATVGWLPEGTEGIPAYWRSEWSAPYDLDLICHELMLCFTTGFRLTDDVAATLDVFPGSRHPWGLTESGAPCPANREPGSPA